MCNRDDIKKYDDIIELPHHVSSKHPHMSNYDRAAQFAPFAALTGHGAALQETARLTDKKIELDEYEKEIINEKLRIILAIEGEIPEITVVYFIPDDKKSGGKYEKITGVLKKIDIYKREIIMTDGTVIPVENISDIESELFENFEWI